VRDWSVGNRSADRALGALLQEPRSVNQHLTQHAKFFMLPRNRL